MLQEEQLALELEQVKQLVLHYVHTPLTPVAPDPFKKVPKYEELQEFIH